MEAPKTIRFEFTPKQATEFSEALNVAIQVATRQGDTEWASRFLNLQVDFHVAAKAEGWTFNSKKEIK